MCHSFGAVWCPLSRRNKLFSYVEPHCSLLVRVGYDDIDDKSRFTNRLDFTRVGKEELTGDRLRLMTKSGKADARELAVEQKSGPRGGSYDGLMSVEPLQNQCSFHFLIWKPRDSIAF